MRRFFSEAEFSAAARQGKSAVSGSLVFRTARAGRTAGAPSARSISYILSTGGVARDGHTVNQDGWHLDAYRANPIFCWAHDTSEPPIGRMTQLGVVGAELRGTVEYADAGTFPFADTIFRLVKGGFLNAVSVSWDPISWKYSTDRNRPGGIDFLEQELMEVSQVPLPADVNAIATARAAGIDTAPMARWAEAALDLRRSVGMQRSQLETLYRAAKPAARASSASLPRAARLRTLRRVAFLGAALGAPLPAFAPAPMDAFERRCVRLGKLQRPK